MSRARVLVIDDKPNNLKLFDEILTELFVVATARSGERALAMLELSVFDVVVTDIRMPGTDGFGVLRETKRLCPTTEVILMTAYGSIPRAVEAMKEGAFNYLTKPVDPDELIVTVQSAVERRRRQAEGADGDSASALLVGKSPAIRRLLNLLKSAAESDLPMLIYGERGTEKDVAAAWIHENDPRRDGPQRHLQCDAFPEPLLHAELFGNMDRAIKKVGLFEQAKGGTVFLEEVGALPMSVQATLETVLEESDVRVIASTSIDLEEEVLQGRFRRDLLVQLSKFPLVVPPLRERLEDIPLLCALFIARHRAHEVSGVSVAALDEMMRSRWPGNVQELENAIECALAACEGSRIGVDDLPALIRGRATEPDGVATTERPFRETVELARDRASYRYLIEVMREFGGNVTKAADHAGVERESLHRLLKKYGVRPRDFRGA